MTVNYNQNWYDVLRQIIKCSANGKYNSQSSVNYEGKQYYIKAEFTIEELHFENEGGFVPMGKERVNDHRRSNKN